MMIAIIDYGAGNLISVKNALDSLNVESKIVNTKKEIIEADRIILPGVGSFGFMMESLRQKGLEAPIKDAIAIGKPFLGICLGMQVLFEESEESPGIKGLCILKGRVAKFKKGKVPQVGWNKIMPSREKGAVAESNAKQLLMPGYMYFVNSYYVIPYDKSIVSATSDYFIRYTSAIRFNNITAVQFHPERSGKEGLAMLKRWLVC